MFLSKLVTITKQYGVVSQKTAVSILISVLLLQRMFLVFHDLVRENAAMFTNGNPQATI